MSRIYQDKTLSIGNTQLAKLSGFLKPGCEEI